METLVMPVNYVELQEDEMMYLDGGGIPRWAAAFAIDIAIMATPLAPLGGIKFLARNVATKMIKDNAWGLARWIVDAGRGILGAGMSFSVNTLANAIIRNAGSFTSVGGVMAFSIDMLDGNLNGELW